MKSWKILFAFNKLNFLLQIIKSYYSYFKNQNVYNLIAIAIENLINKDLNIKHLH